ncbi:unnamed protein product, partial [Didymodactylos carnosus]
MQSFDEPSLINSNEKSQNSSTNDNEKQDSVLDYDEMSPRDVQQLYEEAKWNGEMSDGTDYE